MLKFIKPACFLLMTSFITSSMNVNAVENPKSPLANSPTASTESATAQFIPPQGWRLADAGSLPKNILLMVVGTGGREFPPSINLGVDTYKGSLKDYLKVVKSINEAHGDEWKDLGTIKTEAGEASLSQFDTKMNWGNVRMMQVILIKGETVYILTAAALKEEFPKFYKEFFKSMRSLQIK